MKKFMGNDIRTNNIENNCYFPLKFSYLLKICFILMAISNVVFLQQNMKIIKYILLY